VAFHSEAFVPAYPNFFSYSLYPEMDGRPHTFHIAFPFFFFGSITAIFNGNGVYELWQKKMQPEIRECILNVPGLGSIDLKESVKLAVSPTRRAIVATMDNIFTPGASQDE
jgi:hypothetical protein